MSHKDFSQLTYLIAQDRTDEIYDYLDVLYKKGKLGNKNLSGKEFEIKTGKDGKLEIIYNEAKSGESQNDIVYNALKSYIQNTQKLMEEEGLIKPIILNPDMFKNVFDQELIENINTIGGNASKLNDLQKTAESILKIRNEIDAIVEKNTPKSDKKSDQQQNNFDLQSNQQIQKLQQKLSEKRTLFQQIKNGELDGYYLGQAKFILNPGISGVFTIDDVNQYSLLKKKISYESLNDEQKEEIDEDFNDYMNVDGKYKAFKAYNIYLNVSQMFGDRIMQEVQSLKNVKFNELFSGKVQGSILNSLAEQISNLDEKKKNLENKDSKTEEDEKELENIIIQLNALNTKYSNLINLPSTLLLSETTPNFNFFDRDAIINIPQDNLETFKQNLDLYAQKLNNYYQYLSDNNIVSKGDSDLLFLLQQTVKY